MMVGVERAARPIWVVPRDILPSRSGREIFILIAGGTDD